MAPTDMEHLRTQVATMNATLMAFASESGRRFDEQAAALREIKTEVNKTNGRVTTLENLNVIDRGIRAAGRDPGNQVLTWRVAAAILGFAGLTIAGTISVLSFLGMLVR